VGKKHSIAKVLSLSLSRSTSDMKIYIYIYIYIYLVEMFDLMFFLAIENNKQGAQTRFPLEDVFAVFVSRG